MKLFKTTLKETPKGYEVRFKDIVIRMYLGGDMAHNFNGENVLIFGEIYEVISMGEDADFISLLDLDYYLTKKIAQTLNADISEKGFLSVHKIKSLTEAQKRGMIYFIFTHFMKDLALDIDSFQDNKEITFMKNLSALEIEE